MNIRRVLALFLALSLRVAAQTEAPRTAPKADDRFKADVLLIVAHPDDETGVSAYLAQLLDQGKRVAAVYLTHGEAGHNNMGRERGPSLGAVREMELRHAMTQLGVQNVWFLGGKDTPSQDVLQSLANWNHGANLEGVVRLVRLTRPEVIISWLPGFFMGENHGDHQAAGVLAVEAFDSAGDPSVFPHSLRSLGRSMKHCSRICSLGNRRKYIFILMPGTTKTSRARGRSIQQPRFHPAGINLIGESRWTCFAST